MTTEIAAELTVPTERRRRVITGGLLSGYILFGIILLTAIVAPIVLGDAANEYTRDTNQPPSAAHWLGTDNFGRDALARTLVGTQTSLLMAAAATAIAVIGGSMIGTSIWLAPRRVREGALRVLELTVAYPSLLVALIIAVILSPGPVTLIIAIGVASIPSFARLTANLAATIATREYVTTAKLLGVPPRVLIVKHMLPNMAEPLLILAATTFSVVIMEISGLSFVGLGVQAPDYDLGTLLADALPAMYSRPIEILGPAIMITLMALSAMLIGDGLAGTADPRSSRMLRLARKKRSRPGKAVAREEAHAVVEVEDLSVTTADGLTLVHGSSFSINEGEVLAIVGESGSGKSLTAMAIAGLLPDELVVEADRLRVAGIDVRSGVADPKGMAESVALVYQDPSSTFNQALRMRSQLTEVLRVHRGYNRAQAEEAIVDALVKVQIPDPHRLLGAHPYELSGGMRQRAMIASALAVNPPLIIADEPTTALDVTVQLEILREFRAVNRETGTSMLFISHDLGVVEALCDRVLVMEKGRIVEELTGKQLADGDASHPYTRKLLAATPRIDDRTDEGVQA